MAYSGGADSTALLHAAAACMGWIVHAVHVHHGLQAAADGFAAHCRATCAKLGVAYHQIDLNLTVPTGQSSEALAREHRYDALAHWAQQQGVSAVLIAHHAQDQAESVLLALTRGAGVAGLAGMPMQFEHGGVRFVRPLLGVSGQAIRQYLDEAGIAYLQDPMNEDMRYTRSRIRQHVIPALAAHFESFETLFARSSSHAAKAAETLAEVAQSDLSTVGEPPRIRDLQQLSPLRQANALRYWIKKQCSFAPSTVQLQELQKQIKACQTRGHHIELLCANGVVRRVGDGLVYEPVKITNGRAG